MTDQQLMENLLQLEKGACDLFLHATVESSSKNVHTAFARALNDALCMQDTIHTKMVEKGWYPTEQADQSKVSAVKQKLSAQG